LLGYARSEVDRVVAGLEAERQLLQAELERLRATPAVSPEVSGHLAALLQSFAETVAEGQREAEVRAAQIVADAEERAAQLEANALKLLDQANEMVANTYAEAAARYQEATSARQNASERIGAAVERLAGALAILGEAPDDLPAAPGAMPATFGLRAVASVVDDDTDRHDDADRDDGAHRDEGTRAPVDDGDAEASQTTSSGPADGDPAITDDGGGAGEASSGPTFLGMVRPHPAA
jgi:hypothetical protein